MRQFVLVGVCLLSHTVTLLMAYVYFRSPHSVLCPQEYGPFPRTPFVGSHVTFSPTNSSPCSCGPEHCANITSPSTTVTSPPTTVTPQTPITANHSRDTDSLPTIYIISPTHSRLTQKVDLTTVCYTFMHVPKLIWIVVEDSNHKSDLVKSVLKRCQVPSIHLNAVTPQHYKTASWKPRGVAQRNAGLQWIREHRTTEDCNGVVYFADDDNKYDLRLFVEMRKTVQVSVWQVAFAGGLKYEGPECESGVAVNWHASWGKNRPFPIDMAGFAIHLCLLLEHKGVVIGKDRNGRPSQPGFLETNILEQLITKDKVECRGPKDEVYVWHTKTQKPETVNESRDPSKPNVEV